ncbi:RES family NAD+ phosphorylase [Streptomyces albidocamelliae]|uniref:RES family NAD+ phosphorylase n=1 Tax=Streptomyces albidocamelliae TaxID=2981135 RepID=A0ABY6ETU9_9ACTN|nr:RES family NAD+ phosphorylase [Streptomyces sp. HUAS 14-6]UXY37827.1 RES family NAD+ phosphorylase [Streptomyces sp. HUAS 14-6]
MTTEDPVFTVEADYLHFYRIYPKVTSHGDPGSVIWFGFAGYYYNDKTKAWDLRPGNRYDPVRTVKDGSDPGGTCYVADMALGAFVEVFVRLGAVAISESTVFQNRMATVSLNSSVDVCNVMSPANVGLRGMEPNLWNEVGPPYPKSQQFAKQIRDEGLKGIHFRSVRDPSGELENVATFSEKSGLDVGNMFHVVADYEIPPSLIESAADRYKIQVARDPSGPAGYFRP